MQYVAVCHSVLCLTNIRRTSRYVCHSVLKCVVVCCSILQYVVVCCRMLQSVVSHQYPAHQKVCVLQCVAVCYSVVQYDAKWYTTSTFDKRAGICIAACCSALQYAAVCCSILQCVAVCCTLLQCVICGTNIRHTSRYVYCSVLQSVEICFSMSQHVAVCCSVLQCVVVCCSALYLTNI